MELERLKYLYQRYLDNSSSPEELEELEEFINNPDYKPELTRLLDATWQEIAEKGETEIAADRADSIFKKIVSSKRQKRHFLMRSLAAAAMIVVTFALAFYIFREDRATEVKQPISRSKSKDILPGGNTAILTLADGRQVELDKVQNGQLSSPENVDIRKVDDGLLVFSATNGEESKSPQYNILTVPAGGNYQVNLPDGSKVWLNSQSSLKFPAFFSGKERNVEMLGEAYFEISKDPKKPFSIKVNGLDVMVLGTRFNIRAYSEEGKVSTTLLEGSVRLENAGSNALLVPGQQAVVTGQDQKIVISEGDTDAAIGWKNGYFHFSRHKLQDIMNEIARWYDVKVIYKGEIPKAEFVGKIRRSLTLSEALSILSTLSEFTFTVEGRTIVVSERTN